MVTVITGFNKQGLEQYGYKALEAFRKHWPESVKHIVYIEEPDSRVEALADEVRYMHQIQSLIDFIDINRSNKEAAGRLPRVGWKSKDVEKGYCYKFDILKFCKQVMYLYDAAVRYEPVADSQYMVWLDGDVLSFKDIPDGFIESLVPDGKAVSYLGRGNKHSEIGILVFKLPDALPVIFDYALPIINNSVFELDEWHSAYLFDHARKQHPELCHNMTPNGSGHVWFQSKLGEYMDHLKGDRKSRGRSKERRF